MKRINLEVEDTTYRAYQAAAKASDMTLAGWARVVLSKRVGVEEKKLKPPSTSPALVKAIRALAFYVPINKIAEELGLSESAVSRIARGERGKEFNV